MANPMRILTQLTAASDVNMKQDLRVDGESTLVGNVEIRGDLHVKGQTTYLNTETVNIKDHNIILGAIENPADISDMSANGGGITLSGSTDKTLAWSSDTSAWTSSENVDLAENKKYLIDGEEVVSKDSSWAKLSKNGGTGAVMVSSDTVTISGELTVQNNAIFNSDITASANIEVAQNAKVSGNISIGGNVTVLGSEANGTKNLSIGEGTRVGAVGVKPFDVYSGDVGDENKNYTSLFHGDLRSFFAGEVFDQYGNRFYIGSMFYSEEEDITYVKFSSGPSMINEFSVYPTSETLYSINITAGQIPEASRELKSANYAEAHSYESIALGDYSIATGERSIALAPKSQAHGLGTVAATDHQIVLGTYNNVTPNYNFIVGAGSSPEDRFSALRVSRWEAVFDNQLLVKRTQEFVNLPNLNQTYVNVENGFAEVDQKVGNIGQAYQNLRFVETQNFDEESMAYFYPPNFSVADIEKISVDVLTKTYLGSQTIPKQLDFDGSAAFQTTVSKWAGSALTLPGESGARISPGANLGIDDFTTEMWIYLNSTGSQSSMVNGYATLNFRQTEQFGLRSVIVDTRNASGGKDRYAIFLLDGGRLGFYNDDFFDMFLASSGSISPGAWHHIAVVRQSGTFRFYIDGVQDANYTDVDSYTGDFSGVAGVRNLSAMENILLGRSSYNHESLYSLDGYIEDFRVSDTARYYGNYSVPTEPFSVDGSTLILASTSGEVLPAAIVEQYGPWTNDLVSAQLVDDNGSVKITISAPAMTSSDKVRVIAVNEGGNIIE